MKPIDADALHKKVKDEIYKFYNDVGGGYCYAEDVLEDIDNAPTIETKPVRHGKWKHYPDCGVTRCSECDWSIEECWYSNFCPNCGAKMSLG